MSHCHGPPSPLISKYEGKTSLLSFRTPGARLWRLRAPLALTDALSQGRRLGEHNGHSLCPQMYKILAGRM